MNKTEKRFGVIIFVISVAIFLSVFKTAKIVSEKRKEIEGLSLKVKGLTLKGQELEKGLAEKEKELTQAKVTVEDLNYKVGEEKERCESFQEKYRAEKTRGDGLEENLNKLQTTLEGESKSKEKFALEIEKLKEEKEILSDNFKKAMEEKAVLERFIAEGEKEDKPEAQGEAEATVTTVTAKIVSIYPQGLLAIELEKGSYDRLRPGKIVTAEKEIKISSVHGHMLLLETAQSEAVSVLKKGDVIKYVR